MPVNSTHEVYDRLIESWELVRDCYEGARGLQGEREERYLPRLSKQTDPEYYRYRKRAIFFNAVKRTVQAMTGFVFRQNPEVVTPNNPVMAEFLRDCTLTGKSFYDYAKETVGEVHKVGGRGTLVDWRPEPNNRPFLIAYEREDIRNWRYDMIGGQSVLALLVLCERSTQWIRTSPEEKEPDEFSTRCYQQFRVITLEQDTPDGEYYVYVRVFRPKAGMNTQQPIQKPAGTGGVPTTVINQIPIEFVLVDQMVPMRGTNTLNRIPFVFHGSEINDIDTTDIPMETIAEINVGHYRNSADYENALHRAGQPTLVLTGFDFSDKAPQEGIRLGSEEGLVSDNVNAKAEYVSYDANKASALTGAMDKKEEQMAAQGARILEKQTSSKGVEAFETVQLREGAGTSALMTMTIANTQSLTDVLQWTVWWTDRSIEQPEDLDSGGEDDKAKVYTELNTEFIQLVMDSPMLHELTAAYLQGAISFDTYFENMQKGGVVSSERKKEEEEQAIKDSPVNVPAAGALPTGQPGQRQQQQPPPGQQTRQPPKQQQQRQA